MDVSANHDDTSISLTVSGVSSQGGTHTAKTTVAPDNTTNHGFQNSASKPSYTAQDSSIPGTHALRQDHSQSQQPYATPQCEPDDCEAVTTGSNTSVLSLAHTRVRPAGLGPAALLPPLPDPGASPHRLWMLADADRASQYERAVRHVVEGAGPGAVCITSGAGAHVALAAAACVNVHAVICLQVSMEAAMFLFAKITLLCIWLLSKL